MVPMEHHDLYQSLCMSYIVQLILNKKEKKKAEISKQKIN